MFSLLILIGIMSTAVGMSTTPHHGHHHSHHTHVHGHHTGPTHEPNVNEAFAFHYEAATHTMVARTNRHCYLYLLSAEQQTSVHTSTGLHTIEKTIIDMIDMNSPTVAVSAQDLNTLSASLAHFCRNSPAVKLN
uniref:Uncharacterized protein LOC111122570 n=1 Tax=Crassostrea virginica TaxID=6565 RepID=A0A8B8CW94_CRAVI|nr:uncharacterized protein LOC111122570 [Crassostrea virginica]